MQMAHTDRTHTDRTHGSHTQMTHTDRILRTHKPHTNKPHTHTHTHTHTHRGPVVHELATERMLDHQLAGHAVRAACLESGKGALHQGHGELTRVRGQ